MFDHILLRQESHMRGRTRENILELIMEGIREVNAELPVEVLDGKTDAIAYAVSVAKPGAFITALSDVVHGAIDIVQSLQEKERNS
jgi:cyanophycin synthetase